LVVLTPPVSGSQPRPAEVLRQLEQEETVLLQLQAKLLDQLHRLQVEELVLRMQAEDAARQSASSSSAAAAASTPPIGAAAGTITDSHLR
jgi:hypothetical protein